jgi:broad-specificity NMP kinase
LNNNVFDKTIWIIRGAPGVGKSSVGRRLKKRLSSSAVIEVDILRSMRADINWTDDKSHKEGLQQAATFAESFVKIGLKPVIIIDTLLGENLDFFVSLLVEEPFKVTLIAKDENLLSRAKARTSGFENERVILEMNHWFRLNTKASCHTIDTTLLSVDEVTDQILQLANLSKVHLSQKNNRNETLNTDMPKSINPVKPNGRLP